MYRLPLLLLAALTACSATRSGSTPPDAAPPTDAGGATLDAARGTPEASPPADAPGCTGPGCPTLCAADLVVGALCQGSLTCTTDYCGRGDWTTCSCTGGAWICRDAPCGAPGRASWAARARRPGRGA
jgi:hypothetical protein